MAYMIAHDCTLGNPDRPSALEDSWDYSFSPSPGKTDTIGSTLRLKIQSQHIHPVNPVQGQGKSNTSSQKGREAKVSLFSPLSFLYQGPQ